MTEMLEPNAQLIYAGEAIVSLPKISDLIGAEIGAGVARITDVSLTGLSIVGPGLEVSLDTAFEGGETILSVALRSEALTPAQRLARLAKLVFGLARILPISHVVWAGTDLRIARDTFVAGLVAEFGAEFGAAEADRSVNSTLTQIAPRRVARAAAPATARPDAETRNDIVARMLPAVNGPGCLPSANASALLGAQRHDAHVQAFHAQMRATLLRDASVEELQRAEAEREAMPVEVRLSNWAISLSVATVSLPVAAPVMIYNIARGEDMRVASLAMGLAGLFLALDSSGAVAAVTSF